MMRKRRGGFTITEFLIVALIETIIIAIAAQVFFSLNRDYRILTSYLSSHLKGREVIDAMSKDCRAAVRVMDSYSGYVTQDDCLVLKVPSVDSAGNIIDVNNKFDYIIYRLDEGDFWKTVAPDPSSARKASDDVVKKAIESLFIRCDGVGLGDIAHKSTVTRLTIWVSVSEMILGSYYRVTPGTTVKLMNYEWEFVR